MNLHELCDYIYSLRLLENNNLGWNAVERMFKQHFPDQFCGVGSSRVAIKLSPTMAMKIAFNETGISQNEMEYDNFVHIKNTKLREWITDIRYISPNKQIMIVELAHTIQNEREFQQYTGVPFGEKDPRQPLNLIQYLAWWERKINKWDIMDSFNKAVDDFVWRNYFVRDLHELLTEYPQLSSDINHFDNWGVVNGKVVIIDYGFDYI